MLEEFHGDGSGTYKLLYGWNTLSTNIWLPSVSELVGIDPNNFYALNGCYFSAMQGLNMSNLYYWVDIKGGTQFSYFIQYNASGGGQQIWEGCNQEITWLRTPYCGTPTHSWAITAAGQCYWETSATARAVHPAVEINRNTKKQ